MQKEILGTHFIDETTVITDNKTHLQYQVIETNGKGIKQKLISSLTSGDEIFVSYEALEKGFIDGHITISGYEISDGKILHLVINDLKKIESHTTIFSQLKKTGSVQIKKKVRKLIL